MIEASPETFAAMLRGRPERFTKPRDVGAHLSLALRRCGDEPVRSTLYEAPHSLLVPSKKWSVLRAWGMNVAKYRGMAYVRVAIARKLTTIFPRMWTANADFRFGCGPAINTTEIVAA